MQKLNIKNQDKEFYKTFQLINGSKSPSKKYKIPGWSFFCIQNLPLNIAVLFHLFNVKTKQVQLVENSKYLVIDFHDEIKNCLRLKKLKKVKLSFHFIKSFFDILRTLKRKLKKNIHPRDRFFLFHFNFYKFLLDKKFKFKSFPKSIIIHDDLNGQSLALLSLALEAKWDSTLFFTPINSPRNLRISTKLPATRKLVCYLDSQFLPAKKNIEFYHWGKKYRTGKPKNIVICLSSFYNNEKDKIKDCLSEISKIYEIFKRRKINIPIWIKNHPGNKKIKGFVPQKKILSDQQFKKMRNKAIIAGNSSIFKEGLKTYQPCYYLPFLDNYKDCYAIKKRKEIVACNNLFEFESKIVETFND